MKNKLNHLVFYDGECGLCDRTVQTLFKADKERQFAFAPLQGTTAARYLKDLPPELKNVDSIILIEDYKTDYSKIYVRSQAVFRLFWLMGRPWTAIGWLSFLPSVLFDWAYRLVAKNRKKLFPNTSCFIPPADQKDRFLP